MAEIDSYRPGGHYGGGGGRHGGGYNNKRKRGRGINALHPSHNMRQYVRD